MGTSALRSPRDSSGRFVNWAGTVVTTPSRWREPSSVDEVAALVRAASSAGGRVRAVGAGHSWSAVAAPDDVAVSLDRLTGIASLDVTRGLATVRGGTRIRHLNEELAARGFALPIVGSIAHQSIAGAVATGTHGSSLTHGNLASLVTELVLVTGRGEVLRLGAGDPRLAGARVHLGALGIVTEVTLRVEPEFRLRATVETLPIERAVREVEAIARSAEYVKIWWIPHVRDAFVYRYERTSSPSSRLPSAAHVRWLDEEVLQKTAFPAVVALQRLRPSWLPALNRLVAPTLVHGPRVAPSSLALSTPMPLVHRETEAALPLTRAAEAFDRVVRIASEPRHHVNFPVEVRFVRGDEAWLSPAQGADTCQIGAYVAGVPGVDAFFAAFWREMRDLGARPHWGKELDHDAAELVRLYPRVEAFRALRAELDPERVFTSPFVDRVLPR